MEIPPGIKNLLEKLGVNTTRLQWKLYQMERRRERIREDGMQLPLALQWLNNPNKKCMRCGAFNAPGDRTCHECGARLPSVGLYRVMRLLGFMQPTGSPQISFGFIAVIGFFFPLGMVRDGASFIWNPNSETLIIMGAWVPSLLLQDAEWWRMMAFGLLHFGIIHIGFNGFAFSQLGPAIEQHSGFARMLVLVTFTQITAALGSYLWYIEVLQANALTVGASGIVFGLIGYGISYFRPMGGGPSAIRQIYIQWLIYGILFGILIGANNAAHIGGAIGGLMLGYLPEGHMRRPFWTRFWIGAAGISAGIWATTLIYMAVSILTRWQGIE